MSGLVIPIVKDRDWTQQIFRPIFLTQGIFIGFTCITPIFYFADHLGFIFFTWFPDRVSSDADLIYLAECQRLYLLGHIGYILGILLFTRYPKGKRWKLNIINQSRTLFILSYSLIMASFALLWIPGFAQFSSKVATLGYVATVFCLGLALNEKNRKMIFISSIIVFISFINSFLTGHKEDSIVMMVLLGLILFPIYRFKIAGPGLVLVLLWFAYVPVFNNTMREYSWFEGYDRLSAAQAAFEDISEMSTGQFLQKNWAFFTGRFSEVSMFEIFRRNTPEIKDYYGFEIINNSILALIPRAIWPDKPNTEIVAMERVWEAGIVERETNVSAKTHYYVDSYLSFGAYGVFFFLFLLGSIAALASSFAEYLFGGYYWGSAIMFTGLFRFLWTGTTFEFMFNALLWSFVLLYFFHFLARMAGYIRSVEES